MIGIHCGKCVCNKQKGLIKGCKIYQRNKLVVENLGLVGRIAKEYRSKAPMADLIQLGTEGLLRAAEDYDPKRGKFSTYASWWIRSKITRGIVHYNNIPTGPRLTETLIPINRFIAKFRTENNRYPTPEEIVNAVKIKDCTEKRMRYAIKHNSVNQVDISPDYLPSGNKQETLTRFKEIMARFTSEEQQVIEQRLKGYNHIDIGNEMDQSSENIRNIEKRVIRKCSSL